MAGKEKDWVAVPLSELLAEAVSITVADRKALPRAQEMLTAWYKGRVSKMPANKRQGYVQDFRKELETLRLVAEALHMHAVQISGEEM